MNQVVDPLALLDRQMIDPISNFAFPIKWMTFFALHFPESEKKTIEKIQRHVKI